MHPKAADPPEPNPDAGDNDAAGQASPEVAHAIWPRLTAAFWLPAALTLGVAVVVTIPRLSPGICIGDPGDLQLASDTLGIMHPPGYTGYVTIGYFLTRIPWLPAPYIITLACLATGLLTILLAMMWQVRLGVNPWIAGAIGLSLLGHPQFWLNLLAPEVYAPSVALLAASGYGLLRYSKLGRRRDLFLACLCYGFLVANRAPATLVFPFFVLAWWMTRKRWDVTWRRSASNLAIAAGIIVAPTAYAFGYLWVRDRPDIEYNYIQQDNTFGKMLPAASQGPEAKLRRVWWQMAGLQFREYMGNTWHRVGAKMRWMWRQLLPEQLFILFLLLMVVVGFGLIVCLARFPTAGWLLLGFALSDVVFVAAYDVHGQAADVVPILFAMYVLFGITVSQVCDFTERVFLQRTTHFRPLGLWAGLVTTILLVIWTFSDVENWRDTGKAYDARPFLAELDMDTLPPRTAIFSIWPKSPPLWYAELRLNKRSDVEIVNATTDRWYAAMLERKDRLILTVINASDFDQRMLIPYRNVWRVDLSKAK